MSAWQPEHLINAIAFTQNDRYHVRWRHGKAEQVGRSLALPTVTACVVRVAAMHSIGGTKTGFTLGTYGAGLVCLRGSLRKALAPVLPLCA
jgi:hypothetical protein